MNEHITKWNYMYKISKRKKLQNKKVVLSMYIIFSMIRRWWYKKAVEYTCGGFVFEKYTTIMC